MTSVPRQVHPARPLILLRLRFQAGEPVTLRDAFDAAGLADHARHVVRQRLAGRSHRQIAGRSCTRQRIQQVERVAVARLGLSLSIAQAVHSSQRADQASEWADRSELVNGAELHGEGRPRRRIRLSERETIYAKLDALANRWIDADEAERSALRAEADRLAERLACAD